MRTLGRAVAVLSPLAPAASAAVSRVEVRDDMLSIESDEWVRRCP